MPSVSTSIHLDAPVEVVWSVVADPARLEDWVTIHSGFPDGPPPALSPGSTFDQDLSVAGQDVGVTWTVEALDEPRELVWSGEGPMGATARTRYVLAAEDGGTRLRVVESGFRELAIPAEEQAAYATGNVEGWDHVTRSLIEHAGRVAA